MIKKTMRIVATHPKTGVPFPGQPGEKLRAAPRNVPRSPYWLRYLDMGLVEIVPEVVKAPVPEVMPVMGEE